MLDLWNSTEPFQQVLYIVILVCIPLLLLSIYKVWRWTRREDVVKRFEQHRQKQQSSIFYKLYLRIGKLRAIWYCGGFAVVIALSGMLLASLSKGWRVGGLVAGVAALYLANNWYVAHCWRCPACGERLPCLIGRSALRPKWIERCPHCDYGNP